MQRFFILVILTPCLLPVLGLALLALAALWRTMQDDSRRRKALEFRGPRPASVRMSDGPRELSRSTGNASLVHGGDRAETEGRGE